MRNSSHVVSPLILLQRRQRVGDGEVVTGRRRRCGEAALQWLDLRPVTYGVDVAVVGVEEVGVLKPFGHVGDVEAERVVPGFSVDDSKTADIWPWGPETRPACIVLAETGGFWPLSRV